MTAWKPIEPCRLTSPKLRPLRRRRAGLRGTSTSRSSSETDPTWRWDRRPGGLPYLLVSSLPMPNPDQWDRAAAHPEFQALMRATRRFVIPAVLALLAYYL